VTDGPQDYLPRTRRYIIGTWRQKLETGRDPKVVRLKKTMSGVQAGSLLLVSSPREVDAYIRAIPNGGTVDQARLRADLAAEHGAGGACAISTGIFVRIASEAAWEEMQQGKSAAEVAPFWRVVDPDSALAGKLTCGAEFIRKMRASENRGKLKK